MAITGDDVERILTDQLEDFYKRWKISSLLIAALTSKQVIDADTRSKLNAPMYTEHEKINFILDDVKRKGVKVFLDFCLVLDQRTLGQTYMVTEVMGLNVDDIRKQRLDEVDASSSKPAYISQKKPPISSTTTPSTSDPDDPFIFTPIQHVSPEFAKRQLADLSNYPMKSKPRGKAVILSVDQFSDIKMDRQGSNMDVTNLNVLFTRLGFKVDTWTNLTSAEIGQYIERERKAEYHAAYDAFIMCVLSHGDKGVVQTHDSKVLRVQEDIVHKFNGVSAPGLRDKPKMFFIQACQGHHKTTGVSTQMDAAPICADGDSAESSDLDAMIREAQQFSIAAQAEETGPTTHEMADILVVNSTIEGYSSFRHIDLGSFFMRDLVTVFSASCHKDHVLDMVTKVTLMLNTRTSGSAEYKQICTTRTQLTHNVYFLPGYYE